MTAHDSGDTDGALAESVHEVAENMDRLALGQPLQNVLRNASSRAAAQEEAYQIQGVPLQG